MEYEPLSHPLSLKFMSGATGVDMSRKSQVEDFLHSATEVQSKITSIGKYQFLACYLVWRSRYFKFVYILTFLWHYKLLLKGSERFA